MKSSSKTYILLFAGIILMFSSGADNPYTASEELPERRVAVEYFSDPALLSLVDSSKNRIVDDSMHLHDFFRKLQSLDTMPGQTVSILHIGDSHVQAGFLTGALRRHFQSDFGNAGRGLIVPYKMAGMNEPRDYAITSKYATTSSKANDREIKHRASTTVTVRCETPAQRFDIWSKDKFSSVTILHHEKAPLLRIDNELDPGTYCDMSNGACHTRLFLNISVDSLILAGFVSGGSDNNTPEFYGFSLENGNSGVLYHEMGLNGAAFEHYMNNTSLLDGAMEALSPDLIIVSLGTNNCYGNNFRADYLRKVVDRFISGLKDAYPGSLIIMATQVESCMRKNVRGKLQYVANPNIKTAAEVIVASSVENNVAYWDFYAAAGGDNANAKWLDKKLFNRDRIHLTESGYVLQADMLYDALMSYFNTYNDSDDGRMEQ